MKNIYEIYADEHPGMFQGVQDVTALMEDAYEAWCRIAPAEKSGGTSFLDAFLGWEDMTEGTRLYEKEVDMLAEAAYASNIKFTQDEWDTVIGGFFDGYFNLGYAPIIDAVGNKNFAFLFVNPNFDKESTITSAYRTLEEFVLDCRMQMDKA